MNATSNRNAVVEVPTPDPNGTTTDFQTSRKYTLGTVSLWMNGLRVVKGSDAGFVELGGSTLRLNEAPRSGDVLQVKYDPA